MSKLPNAPLIEVIFELRWKIANQSDLAKAQYLHGDIFSLLRDKYPFRESLVSPDVPIDLFIHNPIHRFRKEKDGYPLFQIGPGVITLNTTDDSYYWEEYYGWMEELLNSLEEVYPHDPDEMFKPNLIYVDFFDLDGENIINFVNKYLSVNFSQDFYDTKDKPNQFDLSASYPTDLGQLSIKLGSGKNNKTKADGLILTTRINGTEMQYKTKTILNWLNSAHEVCSDLFKKMTKGELHKSFN